MAAILAIVIVLGAALGCYFFFGESTLDIPDSLNWSGVDENYNEVIPILSNHSNRDVKWSSSNPHVATVSENGLVTAVGDGETIITATYNDQTDTCRISVVLNGFTYQVYQSAVTITGYKGNIPSELAIPQMIDGKAVTSIGDSAFARCTAITDLAIPNTVTTIGGNAFSDCINLTDVSLAFGVKSLCDSAFENCTSLKKIIIPASVTSIGNSTFRGCRSLSSLSIKSVTFIGNAAFAECSNVKNIVISSRCRYRTDAFPSHCRVIIN